MQEQQIDPETAAKGKRRLITIFCVMITILLLGILLYYVNCIRPVDNFRTLYTDGQYEAALTLYENTLSKVDGNARKAEQCVRDHLEHAWAQYRDAVIDRSQMETACAVAEKYPALEEDLAALKPDLTLLYASRAAYEEGCSLLDAGQYLDAIAQFSSMSENDTLYIEGTSRIREAQESYCQQIVAQTGALMSQARYEDAMTAVEDALTRFPEATTLTAQKEVIYNAYKDYRKQTSMAEAQAALDQGNLEEALRILAPLKKDYPDDADLSALTDQYEASYCAQIAEAATPLLEERQYRQAFDIVSPAYDIFPENDTIASLYDQAEGHLPKAADALSWENDTLRGTKTIGDNVEDTHGNLYGHAIIYTEPSAISMQTMTYSEGKDLCQLNGRYTRRQGTLAVKAGSRGIQNGHTGTFRIYGDDTLLFEAGDLSEESEPQTFDLDVSGVKTLTFAFESGTGLKYLLGDVNLYRYYEPQES